MSDSTESLSLPRRKRSYQRRRWGRTIRDTKQLIKEGIWLEVIVAVATAVVGAVLRYYTGEPKEMSVVLFSFLFSLAALGVVVVGYLLFYFFTAPSRIYWDDQKVIADLKDQLETHLNLDIGVPLVSSKHLDEGGLVIVLSRIRFTNRSRTDGVSLSMTLRMPVVGHGTRRHDYLTVEEVEGSRIEGAPCEDYLFGSINIDPQKTIEGSKLFFIPSWHLPFYGGSEGLSTSSCLLDIVDHISGKRLTKSIEQKLSDHDLQFVR